MSETKKPVRASLCTNDFEGEFQVVRDEFGVRAICEGCGEVVFRASITEVRTGNHLAIGQAAAEASNVHRCQHAEVH